MMSQSWRRQKPGCTAFSCHVSILSGRIYKYISHGSIVAQIVFTFHLHHEWTTSITVLLQQSTLVCDERIMTCTNVFVCKQVSQIGDLWSDRYSIGNSIWTILSEHTCMLLYLKEQWDPDRWRHLKYIYLLLKLVIFWLHFNSVSNDELKNWQTFSIDTNYKFLDI